MTRSQGMSGEALYWAIRDRHYGVLSRQAQARLRECTAAIVGVGCVGEAEAMMLARLGVGRMILVDPDRLEYSNLGRYAISGLSGVGRLKVENVAQLLSGIDPSLRVEARPVALSFENGEGLIGAADVVFQAIDDTISRIVVHRVAKRCRKSVITMSGASPGPQFPWTPDWGRIEP
jgi:tRNA A37 threonylcarbamoyladenosine dehydratase